MQRLARRGSVMREFMSSFNCCRCARLTFLHYSNAVSTLGGACLDFFERDDGGTTAADIGAGKLVEIDKGNRSERDGDWKAWAIVEMLCSVATSLGETAVGIEELEEVTV